MIINPYSFSSGDPDLVAFLAATSISDPTIESALDTFIDTMKNTYSYWDSFHAIYPFVGGTATTHKYNLVDTTTFIIDWEGTVTHNSNGITGNGTDGLGRTNYVPSTDATSITDHSFGFYSRTSLDVTGRPMGAKRSGSGTYNRIAPYNAGNIQARYCRTSAMSISNTTGSSLGFFSLSCGVSGTVDIRDNGNNSAQSNTEVNLPNYEYCVCGVSTNDSTSQDHTAHNLAFAFIADSFTSTEMGNIRTAVEALQDDLSRGVIA